MIMTYQINGMSVNLSQEVLFNLITGIASGELDYESFKASIIENVERMK